MYVEFLGQPGAGKSAIYSKLIDSYEIFGGTKQDAVRRMFSKKANIKQQMVYMLLPSFGRSFFDDNFIEYRFSYDAIEDFIRDYPHFITQVSLAMNSVKYEPEKIFSLCRRSAERYQLSASTVSQNEVLCLDESFAQRAFSILWRDPDDSFSLQEYFSSVPMPDLLIHVDAPVDLCIERQQKRGRVTVEKEWENKNLTLAQKRTQDLCFDVYEYLSSKTSVVTITNTDTIEAAVTKIHSELSNI